MLRESELPPRREPGIPIGRAEAPTATIDAYDAVGEMLPLRSADAERSSDDDDPRLVLLPRDSRSLNTSSEAVLRMPAFPLICGEDGTGLTRPEPGGEANVGLEFTRRDEELEDAVGIGTSADDSRLRPPFRMLRFGEAASFEVLAGE